MTDLGNSLDLPFEPTSGGLDPTEHVHMSGGVVVMAAVVPVPDAGLKPALIFRFATPDGGFYPAMVLIVDDEQLAKLRPLLNEAIHTARQAASNQPNERNAQP